MQVIITRPLAGSDLIEMKIKENDLGQPNLSRNRSPDAP